MTYNVAMQRLDIPGRIRKLRVDERGYPVPKFVAWVKGKPDFRVADTAFMARAVRHRLCWLCGEQLGRHMAFVIGPMCAVNRTTSEPPSHLECARFAVKACPFMTQPKRGRDNNDLPKHDDPGGVMIERNPGVSCIWVSYGYKTFAANGGTLFEIGQPTHTEWWTRGREATREEVLASIEAGAPALYEIAATQGADDIAALQQQLDRAIRTLVPA
jgi:hypothetical protein